MLTIKYIYPDGTQAITTDWDYVTAETVDKDGERIDYDKPPPEGCISWPAYQVVHAHNENQDRRMTFGPNIPPEDTDKVQAPGRVFVMNETGATVASYYL